MFCYISGHSGLPISSEKHPVIGETPDRKLDFMFTLYLIYTVQVWHAQYMQPLYLSRHVCYTTFERVQFFETRLEKLSYNLTA